MPSNDPREETLQLLKIAVRKYSDALHSDLYIYSGPIELGKSTTNFIRTLLGRAGGREKVSLFLTTFGGDADAAYRIARCLRRVYKRIRLLIAGPCKSAGTLVAIGADELAFGPLGELGPLDVQLTRPGEIFSRVSGLDTIQAIRDLASHAFSTFEDCMIELHGSTGGLISTKMACDIASQFAGGLFQPIAAQIDPYRLAEVERRMKIATDYGERLMTNPRPGDSNLHPGALRKLVVGYPSHDFVIDKQEAESLFTDVGDFTADEAVLAGLVAHLVENPLPETQVIDLIEAFASSTETDHGTQSEGVEANTGISRDDTGENARNTVTPPAKADASLLLSQRAVVSKGNGTE